MAQNHLLNSEIYGFIREELRLNMTRNDEGFGKFFRERPFIDRYGRDAERSVDVMIPVLHTNELWRANLLAAYREIPINRLLIGDGGCIDDSIKIAREFPRVVVLDHRNYTSLGFSLRKLIEAVETDWFVYLHSDVYLPEQWFDKMNAGREKYDWFECGQNITVMVQYLAATLEANRSYSGSQMGRKAAFEAVLPKIEDDYLYRNEDVILARLVEEAGFRYGKVRDVYHDHQVMFKESPWLRRVKRVEFELELSREEEIRAAMTFVKGIVKYLRPDQARDCLSAVHQNIARLQEFGVLKDGDFAGWAVHANPAWSSIFPSESVFPSECAGAEGPRRRAAFDTMTSNAARLCRRVARGLDRIGGWIERRAIRPQAR